MTDTIIKKDDPRDYILLGDQYALGNDVPRDVNKALEYYHLAADNGEPFGLECIGCLLYQEAKTDDDLKEAYEYLTKTDPERRSVCTTFALAEMYRLGQVVEQDTEKAGDLYWSVFGDPKNSIDDYYPRSGLRLVQMYRDGAACGVSIANHSGILHEVKDLLEERPFNGSGIGSITQEEFEEEWEAYIPAHSGPVDHAARQKDYTYAITVNELPVSDEQFDGFVSILRSLQDRQDVSLVIKFWDNDDPQEILIAYANDAYYVELNFPMDDFDWDHPLLLARDGLDIQETADLLWFLTVDELSTDEIALIRYHFREVSSYVFEKKAANPPAKAVTYKEVGFRAVYGHFVVLDLNERLKEMLQQYPDADKANCLLAYGYIDHTAGVSLSIISSAYRHGNTIVYFDTNEKIHSFIRIKSVEDCELTFPDEKPLYKKYAHKVDMLHVYDHSERIKKIRQEIILDGSRDPYFADDVLVYLMKDGLITEGCWARLFDYEDDWFMGVLLDEPNQDFGWHKGDRIAIFLGKDENDKIFCFSNMNPDKAYTSEDLEDGTVLQQAIQAFKNDHTEKNLIEIFQLFRDSFVWIPCRAVLSDRDQETINKMVMEDDDSNSLIGSTFTSQDEIRLVPDLLKSGNDLYFPVFTSPAEMGTYGEGFSKMQKHFLEAILLASNNENSVKAIVVNPFTDNFTLPRENYDIVQNAKSRLKE